MFGFLSLEKLKFKMIKMLRFYVSNTQLDIKSTILVKNENQ